MFTILVVEDDAMTANHVQELLTANGHHVCDLAASSEDAIDKAIRLKPDMILMDIDLQGDTDGIEAAQQIRKHLDIPIVFLTGYYDKTLVERAKNINPLAYLVKPLHEGAILATLEVAIYKQELQEKLRTANEDLERQVKFRTHELIESNESLQNEIKERKSLEKSVRKSKTMLRALLDASVDPALLIDTDGAIISLNEAMVRRIGRTMPELVGQNIYKIGDGKAAKVRKKAYAKAIRKKRLVRFEDQADSGAVYDTTVYPVFDDDDNVIHLAIYGRDITEQYKAESMLRMQLELERLIATLSARFINLPPRTVDRSISNAIKDIGQFLDAIYGFGFLFDADSSKFEQKYSWRRRGIKQTGQFQKLFSAEDRPWLIEQLSECNPLLITDIDDLPEQATFERKYMAEEGVETMMFVPLVYRRSLFGFICFEGRELPMPWTPEIINLLQLVCEIFVSSILRRQNDIELRSREEELSTKTNNLSEVNTAMQVLIDKREKDKDELEERILYNINQLVLPFLKKLQKCHLNTTQRTYADIMETNLADIISPLSPRLGSNYFSLTPKEIQIANLIKQGKSSKDIAEMSGMSRRTVEVHRNNIRKKLGLKHKKANLRTHLLSMN